MATQFDVIQNFMKTPNANTSTEIFNKPIKIYHDFKNVHTVVNKMRFSDDAIVTHGNEILSGGEGNDRIATANGKINSDDAITGSNTYRSVVSGDDVIVTIGNGKIVLQGAATLSEFNVRGNEILSGDDGDDRIATYNDEIYDDVIITGGPGNDVIYCKIDSERINLGSGSGMDKLIGEAGNDILNGGDGNDKLIGGYSEDVIIDYAAIEKNSADAGKAYNSRSLDSTIANEYRQQRLKQLNQRGRR